MKKVFNLGLLLMLSFSLMSSMCSSDDDDGSPNISTLQIIEVVNTAQSGTWRVVDFNDSGTDETSDFNGYDFSFNSDGSLTATNGSFTITGTWSVTDDSSSDDSSSDDDIDFNIFFPVSDDNNFEDLNDDWDIISTTSTRIELIDISGGNGGTDILTFEKN